MHITAMTALWTDSFQENSITSTTLAFVVKLAFLPGPTRHAGALSVKGGIRLETTSHPNLQPSGPHGIDDEWTKCMPDLLDWCLAIFCQEYLYFSDDNQNQTSWPLRKEGSSYNLLADSGTSMKHVFSHRITNIHNFVRIAHLESRNHQHSYSMTKVFIYERPTHTTPIQTEVMLSML